MSEKQPSYSLRILSGPNVGANVAMEAGVFVVGSAIESDLVINDDEVAEQHLKIDFKGKDISILPLSFPLYVQGAEIIEQGSTNVSDVPEEGNKQSWLKIKPFQVITIGNTFFCFGPSKKVWPDIQLPKLVSVRGAGDNGSDESEGVLNTTDLVSEPNPEGTAALSLAVPDEPKDKRVFWKRLLLTGAVPALVLIVSIALVQGAVLFNHEEGPIKNSPRIRTQIVAVIDDLELTPHLSVDEGAKNGFTVSGFVSRPEQLSELRQTLGELGHGVQMHVRDTSKLAQTTQSVIKALGIVHVRVSPGAPGDLVMDGYVTNAGEWKSVLQIVRKDVPGIQDIDDKNVKTLADRARALKSLIVEHGLQAKLKVAIDGDRLIVWGPLTENKKPAWDKVREKYHSLYDQFPKLLDRTGGFVEDADIRLPIRSVSIGDVAYLELRNGQKYMEGAVIGDGFVIDRILANQLVMRKNEREYIYSYGGK